MSVSVPAPRAGAKVAPWVACCLLRLPGGARRGVAVLEEGILAAESLLTRHTHCEGALRLADESYAAMAMRASVASWRLGGGLGGPGPRLATGVRGPGGAERGAERPGGR